MLRFRSSVCLAAVLAVGLAASVSRADDTGVIKGKVVFKGDAEKFKRTELDTTKDPNCTSKIGSYDVIINKENSTLRNVIVSIKQGVADKKFEVPATPAVIDQSGCEYKPHVMAVMEGQKIQIKNSDATNHNIHFLAGKNNEEMNKTQPKKDMVDEITLKAEDEPLKVKCDVHPWMSHYVAIFKHPFFAVTDKAGTFEIKGLPAGKYKVQAWHEKFGVLTMDVEVATGATVEKDFTYEPK